MGDADGSCIIVLGARADAAEAVDSVVSAIVADGWTAAGAAGDGSAMVARSGVYVVVQPAAPTARVGPMSWCGIPAG